MNAEAFGGALVLDAVARVFSVNGLVAATAIVGGRVAATWKRAASDGDVVFDPLRPLEEAEHSALLRAVHRWRRFLGDAR